MRSQSVTFTMLQVATVLVKLRFYHESYYSITKMLLYQVGFRFLLDDHFCIFDFEFGFSSFRRVRNGMKDLDHVRRNDVAAVEVLVEELKQSRQKF